MSSANPDFTPGRPLRAYSEDGRFRDFSTDDLVGQKLNFFKNWTCGAGSDNLFVDMDGNVFGASCKVGGKLGNVFEDLTVPEAWIKCSREVCSCGSDLFIPKAVTDEARALLRKTQNLETQSKMQAEDLGPLAAMERTHAANKKQVYWEIGRRCNYNCSYCWPWIHNNHERHKSLEELVTATQRIQEKFIKDDTVNFIISGGEPTANPAFLDWVRYVTSFGHLLSMHSNGSRLPDYYRELIHYGNLNLSAHFEFWNRERFVKVVEAVTDEKIKHQNYGVGHLEVKIMMTPGQRQVANELETSLRAIPGFTNWCTWAIVPVRGGKNGSHIMDGYDEADFALFGDRR